MTQKMRDGSTTDDPRLGRLPSFDDRSRKYGISPLLDEAGLTEMRSWYWHVPYTLDQGNTSACVGFSWTHEGMAGPVRVPNLDNAYGQSVYEDAKKADEWEGEDYEGTSVLAGAKVMQERGFFMEYRWAFNTDEALRALAYHGPLVIGINWRESMFDPDDAYYLDTSGDVAGGHAILIWGVQLDSKKNPDYVLAHNSWGPYWGRYGNVKIRVEDFDGLLQDDGEACIPMGRKYPQ